MLGRMEKPPVDFFDQDLAAQYDERNRKLAPISGGLHFLTGLVLKDLPVESRVLCVGAGTGAEILSLAHEFPGWTFVALDPSLPMLEACRERVKKAGLSGRCELVHGYVESLPPETAFDGALSLLVAHFVKRDKRLSFFQEIAKRLKDGGVFVNAEISFDLASAKFPLMLKNWESIQALMGATPESLASLPLQLKEALSILPPEETEKLIEESGIRQPLRFFQAFMISAWHGKK